MGACERSYCTRTTAASEFERRDALLLACRVIARPKLLGPSNGFDHRANSADNETIGVHSGCCCSTRVRCLIVSLIRGRCLTASANSSRALSRLLPVVRHAFDIRAVLGPVFELVEVAIVREQWVFGFLLGPIRLVGPPRHVSPRFSLVRRLIG